MTAATTPLAPLTRLTGLRFRPRALLFWAVFAAGIVILFDELPFYAPWAAVGTVLAIRRPANVTGLLLIAAGWAYGLSARPIDEPLGRLAAGTGSSVDAALIFINLVMGPIAYVVLFTVTATFPSGRLPAGRWGIAARIAIAVGLFISLSSFLPSTLDVFGSNSEVVHLANPLGGSDLVTELIAATSGFWYLVMQVILVSGVLSMVVRLRQASGVERQQLRWVVVAFAVLVAALALAFTPILLGAVGIVINGDLLWIPALLAYPLPPIAIGVAILRYRLYELDRILSRTISWAILTVLLAIILVAGVGIVQALMSPVTHENTIAVAVTTLVVAALFQPLRRRVQRAVDRRFDRARYDGQQLSAEFGVRLRQLADVSTTHTTLVATAQAAVKPRVAGVWLRGSHR